MYRLSAGLIVIGLAIGGYGVWKYVSLAQIASGPVEMTVAQFEQSPPASGQWVRLTGYMHPKEWLSGTGGLGNLVYGPLVHEDSEYDKKYDSAMIESQRRNRSLQFFDPPPAPMASVLLRIHLARPPMDESQTSNEIEEILANGRIEGMVQNATDLEDWSAVSSGLLTLKAYGASKWTGAHVIDMDVQPTPPSSAFWNVGVGALILIWGVADLLFFAKARAARPKPTQEEIDRIIGKKPPPRTVVIEKDFTLIESVPGQSIRPKGSLLPVEYHDAIGIYADRFVVAKLRAKEPIDEGVLQPAGAILLAEADIKGDPINVPWPEIRSLTYARWFQNPGSFRLIVDASEGGGTFVVSGETMKQLMPIFEQRLEFRLRKGSSRAAWIFGIILGVVLGGIAALIFAMSQVK